MAVSIDIDAFREALDPTTREAATRLREAGAVGALWESGGGVEAVVRDGTSIVQPWVGVVDRRLTGECECALADPDDAEDLCVHAVAVALAAFDGGVRWSGAAVPPGADGDDAGELARYREAVGRLAGRQVTALVVEQAARDHRFAAVLLREAGMLDDGDRDAALERMRRVVRAAAGLTASSRWQIGDVEATGETLADEADLLCVYPATEQAVDLVERAILVWDELSGHLHGVGVHGVGADPGEVAAALTDAHLDLVERLDLPAARLATRLATLVGACRHDTVDVAAYVGLLGDHLGTLADLAAPS